MSKKEFDVYFSLGEKKLNVAVFKKSAENSIKKSRPNQDKEALTNISLGPATKKR